MVVVSHRTQLRQCSLLQALLLLLLLSHQAVEPALAGGRLYNTTTGRSPSKLNVHIIPHTHLDPGWLVSFDEYYRGWPFMKRWEGSNLFNKPAVTDGVSRIIDSVLGALLLNPDRTFTFADMAFFVKWWHEQSDAVRGRVRGLVSSGQLQFVNGGLVQHDEATSHYSSIVDQMGAGMRFLADELGVEPRVAWMIDDFGHSRSEPLLRTQGGFEALFVTRPDSKDLQERTELHQSELVWRGSPAFGSESDLWVSLSPTGTYTTPEHSWLHEDDDKAMQPESTLMLDDGTPKSFSRNKHPKVISFLNSFYKKVLEAQEAAPPGQNDVMLYFGSDFAFKNAPVWYDLIDKIVHYANREGVVNVMYSTPEKFLAAKKTHAGVGGGAASGRISSDSSISSSSDSGGSSVAWPLKSDDFLPYRCSNGLFWTGFYSTRPTLKGMIRQAAAVLQATRQLEVIAGLNPSSQNLPATKGKDLLHPKPSAAAARTAAAAAAATVFDAQQRYVDAAAAADAAVEEDPTLEQKHSSSSSSMKDGPEQKELHEVASAADASDGGRMLRSKHSHSSSSSRTSSSKKSSPEHEKLNEAAAAVAVAAVARDAAFVSAIDDAEGGRVPDGPDAAVLEFAVALAHHHDAITGTQRLSVRDDYIHWLHVGLQRALPKMLLALQRLVFQPSPTAATADQQQRQQAKTKGAVGADKPAGEQVAGQAAAGTAEDAASPGLTGARQAAGRKHLRQQQQHGMVDAGESKTLLGRRSATLQQHTASAAEAADGAASATASPWFNSSSSSSGSHTLPPGDVVSLAHPLPGLSSAATNSSSSRLPPLSYCLMLNISMCSASVQLSRGKVDIAAAAAAAGAVADSTEHSNAAGARSTAAGGSSNSSGGFLLVVYNPLSWPRRQGVRVPVAAGQIYTVTGPKGVATPSQLLPLAPFTSEVWAASNHTQGRLAASHANTVQLALQVHVPALGHAVYRVAADTPLKPYDTKSHSEEGKRADSDSLSSSSSSSSGRRQLNGEDEVTLTHGVLEVSVSAAAGGITAVRMMSGEHDSSSSSSGAGGSRVHAFSSTLVQYVTEGLLQKPGTYVFAAHKESKAALAAPTVEIVEGPLLTEVWQVWPGVGALVTRLWRGASHLEMAWAAGPPPDGKDWELFVRYSSDIQSDGVWYTDANGLEWQQRKLGHRPAYSFQDSNIPGNLYPMTTGALLREVGQPLSDQRSLYVSTDRAQGVTSLKDGQLDILLHRVSSADDGKGMEQRLIDNDAAVGSHIISFGTQPPPAAGTAAAAAAGKELHARHLQQYLNDPLQLAFSPLPPPGTAVRETSSFLAPHLANTPAAAAGDTTLDPTATTNSTSSSSDGWLSLPGNVHVLSLQWRCCDSVLVRLVNTFQAGEQPGPLADQATVASIWGMFNWRPATAAASVAAAAAEVVPAAVAGARRGVQQQGQQAGTANDDSSSSSSNEKYSWSPKLTLTEVREVTLFGAQRPLRRTDLQRLSIWPLGEQITKWEPALWPPMAATTPSSSSSSSRNADEAAANASSAAAAAPYSFFKNRIVGPMGADVAISLAPMQIRSFLVTVRRSSSNFDFGAYGTVEPCFGKTAVPPGGPAVAAAGGFEGLVAAAAAAAAGVGAGAAEPAPGASSSVVGGTASHRGKLPGQQQQQQQQRLQRGGSTISEVVHLQGSHVLGTDVSSSSESKGKVAAATRRQVASKAVLLADVAAAAAAAAAGADALAHRHQAPVTSTAGHRILITASGLQHQQQQQLAFDDTLSRANRPAALLAAAAVAGGGERGKDARGYSELNHNQQRQQQQGAVGFEGMPHHSTPSLLLLGRVSLCVMAAVLVSVVLKVSRRAARGSSSGDGGGGAGRNRRSRARLR